MSPQVDYSHEDLPATLIYMGGGPACAPRSDT